MIQKPNTLATRLCRRLGRFVGCAFAHVGLYPFFFFNPLLHWPTRWHDMKLHCALNAALSGKAGNEHHCLQTKIYMLIPEKYQSIYSMFLLKGNLRNLRKIVLIVFYCKDYFCNSLSGFPSLSTV